MKKKFLSNIFYFILGGIVFTCATVFAANLILGSEVIYDNSNSKLSSENVNDAIDELYSLVSNSGCPEGYKCKKIEACEYALNHSWSYAYNGGVQEFTVPCEGLYKLEVWGAQGGSISGYATGGLGGYSSGYIELAKDNKLYVVIGSVSYNGGGGSDGGSSDQKQRANGGGATHIAKVTGTLSSIGYSSFVTNGNGLIVAGGGGGAGADTAYTGRGNGSSGGGLTGSGKGGSQTSGYAFGQGQSGSSNSGQGGTGGGGGLYGGYAGVGYSGGGGGSGYIDGVPEIIYNDTTYTPQSSSGVNSGNGKAKITLIAR